MKRPSKPMSLKERALVFGVLPLVIGLSAIQYVRWTAAVWMTDAGGFWPFTLTTLSAAILIKLLFSAVEDRTSAVAAWLALLITWFYVPMWATAVEVPAAAAVISREGRLHLARDVSRHIMPSVRFLTDHAGTRVVYRVAGKVVAGGLEIDYSYSQPFIATRRHGDDLFIPLSAAASPLLSAEASGTRTSRVAFIQSGAAKDGLLAVICRAAVGDVADCPIKMTLSAEKEAAAPGAVWSTQYSESEAIEEKHLPSLVHILTRTDASLETRDKVFGLVLELAGSSPLLAELALKSHLLEDDQFDEVIRRILASPGSADAAAIVASVKRLSERQRQALRDKVIDEAGISTVVDAAAALRLSDAEVVRLAGRMRPTLLADAGVAVRVLDTFGERLPLATQRDAVEGIVRAKATYALAALGHVNFSRELRRALLDKVLAEAMLEDFKDSRLTKEKLQSILTREEMRALVGVAVKRSEGSEKWHEFALDALPVPDMTPDERRMVLNGLLFKGPKAALEFASKNRDFLDPREVAEVTRDYTRTITRDFCLHLSHRNKNWRTNYFSEAQLEIFRECADKEAAQ